MYVYMNVLSDEISIFSNFKNYFIIIGKLKIIYEQIIQRSIYKVCLLVFSLMNLVFYFTLLFF